MIEPGSLASIKPQRHRLRHEERGAHVKRKYRVEILDLDVRQKRRAVHAGIVDQDLKRRGGGDGAPYGLDIGDVEHERIGPLAARADRGGGVLDLALGARRERHMRAGLPPAPTPPPSPMPRPPPVTSARLPSRRKEGVLARSMSRYCRSCPSSVRGHPLDAGALSVPRTVRPPDPQLAGLSPQRGKANFIPPPRRRARSSRRSGAPEHWPARHARRSLRACTAASNIRRSWRWPRR